MAKPTSNAASSEKIESPFKVKRTLTPQLLKFVEDETRYVKITAPVYLGKPQKTKDGEKQKEPAHLADCVNLETGEVMVIIVGAVVASVLAESYADESYVGKSFAITKRSRQPGKQYNPYTVDELDV